MTTEEKHKDLINKSNIQANQADEVKKMHKEDTVENLAANEHRQDGYKDQADLSDNNRHEGKASDRNLSAKVEQNREQYKHSESAESRDSNNPYEDVIMPEAYDTSMEDKDNMNQADQAAL